MTSQYIFKTLRSNADDIVELDGANMFKKSLGIGR